MITDLRELNKRIQRNPYPIPKIQDLLLKLEGFMYATSLDLNMGYYHIELTPTAKKYCTIVFPFGKYEYQRLPMGLCNRPDIFQEKMSELMTGLEFVRVYLDDILCITCGSFKEHLNQLEQVLTRLKDAKLKVNLKKSSLAKPELEYLGYWITREGIKPVTKKIEALVKIQTPRTKRELRRFIGMINFYRDMWIRRSHILAPLARLTSKSVKWKWTDVEQKAFNTIKKVISEEVLLHYPDFNQKFVIHTDASQTQLGAVISQNNKPIAFYSRKLNPAQRRYTTTERELLAIVETLKEFKNILLGQQIEIWTDHKNLTYTKFNTDRVMRWQLVIEEFGPELLYIKGSKNIVADALSRLGLDDANEAVEIHDIVVNTVPENYPLKYATIQKYQQADKELQGKVNNNPLYKLHSFRGGEKEYLLICYHNKIVVPKVLQQRTIDWYHLHLSHPGETRTEETIGQHFTWKNMRQQIRDTCKKCKVCQLTKKKTRQYGHLPAKEAESEPWEILCVDLIGPYKIKRKGKKKELVLWCVTMIDPVTKWFEIRAIPNKESVTVANQVEQAWLTRYPWPTQVIYDRGTEFMSDFSKMIKDDYGVTRKPITARNPQANAVLERIHQTLGNIIRTYQLHQMEVDETDPWAGILSTAMFALRATYHTVLKATPCQVVFSRDAMLNTKFIADWQLIKQHKQKEINKNNAQENQKRIPHEYNVGDKISIKKGNKRKYGEDPYEGPYEIIKVNTNGTIRYQKGVMTDTINIRNVHPYHE